jgi:Putative F0F1-ATPase subunit Ca2+/Mg2+ transporter
VDPSSPRGIGKYLGLATMLPISTGVGYALGYGLDALFHTTWVRWLFMGLGSVAGIFELIYELDKDK